MIPECICGDSGNIHLKGGCFPSFVALLAMAMLPSNPSKTANQNASEIQKHHLTHTFDHLFPTPINLQNAMFRQRRFQKSVHPEPSSSSSGLTTRKGAAVWFSYSVDPRWPHLPSTEILLRNSHFRDKIYEICWGEMGNMDFWWFLHVWFWYILMVLESWKHKSKWPKKLGIFLGEIQPFNFSKWSHPILGSSPPAIRFNRFCNLGPLQQFHYSGSCIFL